LNGTYVNIVLELEDPEHAKNFSMGQALIVSTLFPHETKLSTMHFKLKRTIENKDIVPSKTVTEFHCGFRRMELKPIFSAETNPGSGSEKYRFMRFMRTDCSVVATAYCPIVFTPSKVLCFNRKVDEETGQLLPIGEVLATGVVMPPNPLRIILKRIILTGYPMKAHKKKAVVRYMFFDPKDIKYFKPVELCTKHGLRGHIK